MNLLRAFKFLLKDEIARRYFVMNSFDGALTILGVMIALWLTDVTEAKLIIVSCLGAGIAMLVSGVYGAYAAEKAERNRELKELEKHMMTDLDETRIGEKFEQLSVLIALVDGLSPLLVSLILIVPFILSQFNFISLDYAFAVSFLLVAVILFFLGTFVGKISGENSLKSGAKMVSAGIVVSIIFFGLELLKVV